MMRSLLLLLLVVSPLGCAAVIKPDPPQARPNIIIVMADDMGYSDLGCYGGEIKTPTIDRLAFEGIRFTQFYNFAKCGPSRAALMTGCYPWQVGQTPNANIFANLKGNCITLMQLMHASGYMTAALGRLDMVTAEDWHDPEAIARCTDRFLGSASGGPGNYYRQERGTLWFRDGKRWDRPSGPYSTDLITKFAVELIQDAAESKQPLFIYVSHYAPHWPLQADDQDIAPYREIYERTDRKALMRQRLQRQIAMGIMPQGTSLNDVMVDPPESLADRELPTERMAINAAMVTSIDRSLASILDAMRRTGRLDNTLVLVLSDNGASHQLTFNRPVEPGVRPGSENTFLNQGTALATLNNTPLRGFKMSNYEGGIASPLIAWWPRGIADRGAISDELLQIADIMPTCLDLARATYPKQVDGQEMLPLSGQSFVASLSEREFSDTESKRVVAWPYAIREGDWKLVLHDPNRPELFFIPTDRSERNNLADQYPARVRGLTKLHESLNVK